MLLFAFGYVKCAFYSYATGQSHFQSFAWLYFFNFSGGCHPQTPLRIWPGYGKGIDISEDVVRCSQIHRHAQNPMTWQSAYWSWPFRLGSCHCQGWSLCHFTAVASLRSVGGQGFVCWPSIAKRRIKKTKTIWIPIQRQVHIQLQIKHEDEEQLKSKF